jgi:hypothetical protein
MSEVLAHPTRIVVELQPDGTLDAIYFTNGAQTRDKLVPGFESFGVRDILLRVDGARKREAQRLAERKAREQENLHRRVWTQTATDHGVPFANKTIGPAPGATRSAPRHDTIVASADLL